MRRFHALIAVALGTVTGATVLVGPFQSSDGGIPAFVFTTLRDGDPELWTRATDGTLTKLTSNRISDYAANWSPDGRRLAFVRELGDGSAIYVMDSDGTDVRRLTRQVRTPDGGSSRDEAPSWSPDGTRLVFASSRSGGESEIWRIDADGTDLTRLTRTALYVGDHNPVWSPSGRSIWFDSDRSGVFNREVYRMRPDGTGVQRMTHTADGIDDGAPDIAPDGRRIVFSSTRDHGDQELYTMTPNGADVRRLGDASELRDEVFAQWSADGSQVVYWTFATAAGAADTIWVIDADGTDRRRVTGGRVAAWHPDPFPVP
jgi:Tol biopolymer transport system component